LTVTGPTFQMSSQYSSMALTDENLPLRAVFRIDIRVHAEVVDDAPSQCIGGQPGAAAFVGRGVGTMDDVGHRRIVSGVGNRKVNARRMMYPCAGK
jgi:hypothetical protein